MHYTHSTDHQILIPTLPCSTSPLSPPCCSDPLLVAVLHSHSPGGLMVNLKVISTYFHILQFDTRTYCSHALALKASSLTQPVMYNVINNRSSVPDLYVKQLEVCVYGNEPQSNYHHVHLTTVCSGCANNCWRDFKSDHVLCWWTQPVSPAGWWLYPSCESVQASSCFHSILLVTIPFQDSHLRAHWSGVRPAPNHITAWDTGSHSHVCA